MPSKDTLVRIGQAIIAIALGIATSAVLQRLWHLTAVQANLTLVAVALVALGLAVLFAYEAGTTWEIVPTGSWMARWFVSTMYLVLVFVFLLVLIVVGILRP